MGASRIRVVNGELAGQVHELDDALIVGRSEACGLCLPDRRLSRQHARVWAVGGQLHIEDLDSQHGTYVNGTQTIRSTLNAGDIIDVGETKLRIEAGVEYELTPVQMVGTPARLREQLVKAVRPEVAPDLDQRNFALVLSLGQTIHGERDELTMFARVLDDVLEAVKGDRGYVAIRNTQGELIPRTVRYRDHKLAPKGKDRVAMSHTVAERVLAERCGMISADSTHDDRFATTDTVLLSDVLSLMAVPMISGEQVIGLIQIEVFDPNVSLAEADLDLLTVVASNVAAALGNLRLADQLAKTEQLAAIGRLASGIAHEVKNHLSPFMLADIIRLRYPDDEEVQESVEMMLEAQRHIYGLVDEIRLFARGAQADYDIAPHDLRDVVRGVIRFVGCDAKVKKARINLAEGDSPLVQIDAARIRQVLVNLIRNAADAFEGSSGRIELRVRESGDRAFVDVMDDGKGIPAENIERIFEPFYSTKGDAGLGLGLDIARKIARAHQGDLTCRSEPGKGTTFRLSLPAVPE